MSTHPNAMLLLVLTPNRGSRETFMEIAAHEGAEISEGSFYVNIRGLSYTATVMESDYDEDYQISAEEGQIVLREYLTYGYGDKMPLDKLNIAIEEAQHWAMQAGKRHDFAFEIFISANYW